MSKKHLRASISEFINAAPLNEPLNVEPWLYLLQRHPKYETKTKELKHWFVDKTKYGNKGLFILKHNGDIEGFSYLQCITPITTKQEFVSAMRSEIYEQIKVVKDCVAELFECEICTTRCEKTLCHIDHVIAFKTLSEIWCDSQHININEGVPLFKNEQNIVLFQDRSLAQDWQNFHKKKAILRPLCKTCNLKRGTGLQHTQQ